MSFVSYSYFVFLAICLLAYYIMSHRFRWCILLGASVVFCMMLNVYSTIWILTTTVITYFAALIIEKSNNKGKKESRLWLLLSLILCFGALCVVKYSPVISTMLQCDESERTIISIAMPVGISFYIFQVTGYLIDVYWRKVKAVRHIGHYAVAVTFFGKLTQGPITSVDKLVQQLNMPVRVDDIMMRRGAVTILLGLFKKVVVADRLAIVANAVFAQPTEVNGLSSLIGILFYSFQLYTDFVGYTDIAVGSAMLFGLELPSNFKQPYLAQSIGEFWRRWHITLSTWFKTYIYIPLGGSRVTVSRWAFNTLVVFFVSGLWHGTGFTFVLWGILHGVYQIVGRYTLKWRVSIKEKVVGKAPLVNKITATVCTFVLVSIAWTFFRATTISDALQLFGNILSRSWTLELGQLGIKWYELCFSIMLIGVIFIMDIISEQNSMIDIIERQILPIRWIIYLGFLFALILFGMYGSLAADSFIYVSF